MPAWLAQLALGSSLALGVHFLFVGVRVKPLRGQAWLGLVLAGLALAFLFTGTRSVTLPVWLGLTLGGAAGVIYLTHRFLALYMADRKAMQALSRAYADLQASAHMRELGMSAASISHEIRNYAASLKGNAVLLNRELDRETDRESDPAGQKGELERIRTAADRMEAISRDISVFAGAARSPRLEPLDLERVIGDCLENRFPGKRASVRCRGGARMQGDAARLEQAFMNLFRNAWEAGASGVEVRLTAWHGKLVVAVEDDGRGCSPGDLERIAMPFFSRKGDRGTGLGCSIAESILRAHGATLRAYSKNVLGKGRSGLLLNLVFPSDRARTGDPGGELTVAAGLGPARENLVRPMLHLGLRPRFLDLGTGPLHPSRSGGGPLFLDSEAADRLVGPSGNLAIVVGSNREAVRRPGGGAFLFSEEELIGVLRTAERP
ncbi:MAG: HAMP domain-containing histidine kinase [Fibrobacteres bacterium]|nr:HAMP domain-containing histidine kinase [Fibrobacterota bacterium]